MLEHINIMKGAKLETDIAEFSPILTTNDDENLFFQFEDRIRTKTKNLVNKVKQNGLKNVKIIWSTNSSHLFGCCNDKTIIKFLETEIANYNEKNENFDAPAFEEYLLEKWVEGHIDLSISKEGDKPKNNLKVKGKRRHELVLVLKGPYITLLKRNWLARLQLLNY